MENYSSETERLLEDTKELPNKYIAKMVVNLAKMVIAENGNNDIHFIARKKVDGEVMR